jgi:hypothetical protein
MKTSFDDVNDEIPAQASAQQVAVQGSQEIVTDEFFDQQEIPDGMVRTPRLELAHGVGFALELGFTPGSLVFNRETAVLTPKTSKEAASSPVNMIVLKWKLHYEEKVDDKEFKRRFKEKIKTPRFSTENEARKNGFISSKEKRDNPAREEGTFHPVMTAVALVGGNENSKDFPLEIDGKGYIVAEVVMQKGNFWGLGNKILSAANECRLYNQQIYQRSFNITTKLEAYGSGDPSWSMVGAPGIKPNAAALEMIKSLAARVS